MYSPSRTAWAAAMFFTAMAAGMPAQAQDTAPAPAEPIVLFDAVPADEDTLARISGRENRPVLQSASSSSNATVANNRVGDGSPTGALSVSDSAFQNVSGISMVNLNTGNASSINASLNVNLTITMAPAGMPEM
jgi:hypothetical protein